MSLLPGTIASSSFADDVIHIDETDFLAGGEVVLKSTVTDAGATPTSTIRKGNVIVKKTSDGLFYLDDGTTNAASADRNASASVSTATGIGASFANTTFTIIANGGASFVVTMATATTTAAAVVALLNADLNFRGAGLIADVVSTTAVRIRTLKAGRDQYIKVTGSYANTFGSATASATSHGTDADYRVTEEEISMLDPSTAVAQNTPVKTSLRAYYVVANLCSSNTTISDEARAVLLRNGARFG